MPRVVNPKSVQTFSATVALSPVATFTSMPRPASSASDARAACFGGSANTRKPSSRRPVSSAGSMAVSSGAGLLATATTRRPSANSRSSTEISGTSTQCSITCSGAPFTMSTRPCVSSTSAEHARR